MNSIDTFIRSINNAPVMSQERTRELALLRDMGVESAPGEITVGHMRFALHQQVEMHCMEPYQSDEYRGRVFSYAREGLLEAARRWDWRAGPTFISYARHYIRKEIRKGKYEFLSPLSLPWSVARQVYQKSRYSADTLSEISAALQTRRFYNLDAPLKDDGSPLCELIEDSKGTALFDAVDDADEAEWLDCVIMDELSPREVTAVRMRYWDDARLEDIGDAIRVGRERARQIVEGAVAKLRVAITGKRETLDRTMRGDDMPAIGDWVRSTRETGRLGKCSEGRVFAINRKDGTPILLVRRADGGISKLRPFRVEVISDAVA